ncbi:hypothetical protein AAFF_G00395720 [Aldrovandia affinis]|uniref:MARVEL domain-containing protein n=1 Tax=Aldrovandia affinis TaxID=143900 RepID=A0AAD7SDG3_9TELE|nr:hypothetical protein AAFF_G00395720 [Aldrovandia affinis]
MGDIEPPEPGPPRQAGILDILPSKEFATSRKGTLLIGEVVLSLIIFICFVASPWSSLVSGPLLEFLFAFFMLFAYSTKLNERFKDFHWPLMDFLRCVSASIIYFIISIISVSRSSHSASVAGGVFGFMATVVFAFDFYFIFNELIGFVRQGQQQSTEESPAGNPDNDSDDSD